MTASTTLGYRIRGISSDVTICDCCGREAHKTIALEVKNRNETSDVIRVSLRCASILLGRSVQTVNALAHEVQAAISYNPILVEQALTWKIENRINSFDDIATARYKLQFDLLDGVENDPGVLLTDGKQFARIPQERVLSQLTIESAEMRFVQYLQERGFKRYVY